MINDVKIYLKGHVDDLYALSLLFSEGAHCDYFISTSIVGEKAKLMDVVTDAKDKTTYLSGPACNRLFAGQDMWTQRAIAYDILQPVNGYATLCDSNYNPVFPVSAEYKTKGGSGHIVFPVDHKPSRQISVARHSSLKDLLKSRVDFIESNWTAQNAVNVLGQAPNWAAYYKIMEDIAGEEKISLSRLHRRGFVDEKLMSDFMHAANNQLNGRHGASGRKSKANHLDLMNLLEAREAVRQFVTSWLDYKCGDKLPRDRVDGGGLRFGLEKN